MKNKPIPFVEFHLTEICNYRCEYCCDGKGIKEYKYSYGHAKNETIEGFFEFLKKLGQEYWVQITGGEPFLHPKCMEIIERIVEMGNKISFITNFSLPFETYEKVFQIAQNNLVRMHATFHLSQIDNLEEMIEKAIAVNKIKPKNTVFEIKSLIKDENNLEILKYIDSRLKEHNIPFIYGRIMGNEANFEPYSEEIETFIKKLDQKYINWQLASRNLEIKNVLCWAGCKMFNILWDGTINRCYGRQSVCEYDYLGNLNNPQGIKMLEGPRQCYSKYCTCEHATEKRMYFCDKNADLNRTIYLEEAKIDPKVSIIMPVYNTEKKYLREAIDSVLNQTFSNFELIIVNEFDSKQYVEDVILSYKDERITYIQNKEKSGISRSLNTGIDCARGEYIARMDSDDIALPKRIEKQIKYMDANPDIGICGTWAVLVDKNGQSRIWSKSSEDKDIRTQLLIEVALFHSTVMFRKSIINKHQLRYPPEFTIAEDFSLLIKASEVVKFHNIPEALLIYRVYSTNASIKDKNEWQLVVHKLFQYNFKKKFDVEIPLDIIDVFWQSGWVMHPYSLEQVQRITKVAQELIQKINKHGDEYNAEGFQQFILKRIDTISKLSPILNPQKE